MKKLGNREIYLKKRTLKTHWYDINNLRDKEFTALVIRMLTELGKRMDEHSENLNKKLGNIWKNQSAEEYNNSSEKHSTGN